MKLPDKLYDILKWVVLVVIPASTTLYCLIDRTFKIGVAETVAEISAGVCVFLGAILGFSTAEYRKDKVA